MYYNDNWYHFNEGGTI
ncbi:MAG: hypothetical protein IJ443_06995 [Firmicutes bacterium]|nr:hypothetical protein [Bacillota bacterium]